MDAMKTTIPIIGHRRLNDLFSEQTSPETKANTARWYAELFIDKFLSSEILVINIVIIIRPYKLMRKKLYRFKRLYLLYIQRF